MQFFKSAKLLLTDSRLFGDVEMTVADQPIHPSSKSHGFYGGLDLHTSWWNCRVTLILQQKRGQLGILDPVTVDKG